MNSNLSGDQFHATVNTTWPPSNGYVHLGTRAAAEQRTHDFTTDYHDPDISGVSADNARWKIHQVQTRGRVYPHVLTDEQAGSIEVNEDPSVLEEEGLPSGRGYDVFRYTNGYEDKGSESLMAHVGAVRVRRTEEIGKPLRPGGAKA